MIKKITFVSAFYFITIAYSFGQYDGYGFVITGGSNFSKYLGKGEGNNYFDFSNPYNGFQIELTANNKDGFEWIMYGVAHYKTFNNVEGNTVPVEFWIPYYTEFLFYQKQKTHPLFIFFGYDYVRMRFPNMAKPDSQYNITFGAGWNLKLFDRLYLQFKLKPYFVIDNSIGQWFGFNGLVNIHVGI
jgi:hypothetical protein